jgi:hypothetical protein
MMKITTENIEGYLLDLSEGTLSPEQAKEVELFVLLHPEYTEMMEAASQLPVLESSEIIFENKKDLHRYSAEETDMLLARELEGDLNEDETKELSELIQRFPELNKERERFALTVLQPEQIKFPHKEQLKRRTGIVLTLYPYASRIAALFLLTLLTGAIIYLLSKQNNTPQLVSDKQQDNVTVPSHPSMNTGEKQPIDNERNVASNITSTPSKRDVHSSPVKKVEHVNNNETRSNEASQLAMIEPIKATIDAPSINSDPVMISKALPQVNYIPVASAVNASKEHYMDVYELAGKLVSRFSKGRVEYIHKENEHGNIHTELAVNAGDFQFSRKKSQ